MAVSVNTPILCARPVLAANTGHRIVIQEGPETGFPPGCTLMNGDSFSASVQIKECRLADPFGEVPILPGYAEYPGQIIGIVLGPSWNAVDAATDLVIQERDHSASTESRLVWTDEDRNAIDADHSADQTSKPYLVEGTYSTDIQLHRLDAPLWSEARPESDRIAIRVPTQWPGHVRLSVAAALDMAPGKVDVRVVPVEGGRDGALSLPSLLASLAALCAERTGQPVRLALRNEHMALTGGRNPTRVSYVTRLGKAGEVLSNTVEIRLDCGAYPTLVLETQIRMRNATTALYQCETQNYRARARRTTTNPMGAFEGVGTAQVAFAREVHFNRLAGIAEADPITWRLNAFRQDWPVVATLAQRLADTAGFHRRYAANELVRKRRLQLPRNSTALKGIGCAFGEQISGMTGDRERGFVKVQLEQDGTARLHCSLPTPTPRLRRAWRSIVARELQIDRDQVTLDTACRTDQEDSGPRVFSRGSSVIPRAIQSACQAIQKQRFREPLPIEVRRPVKTSRATRNPADALRSIGGAAVEATIIPATMEIDVRSVTMVIYGGKIMDRHAAETEIRRGIYQAMSWTLHEMVDRTTRETSREPDLLGDPDVQRHYNPGFLGAPPRIKVVLLPSGKRDGPVGIGELPFLTVPAALVSALSQASGLYLDSIPVRPPEILDMLQEEE